MNPQPFSTWIYNEELSDWEAPIPLPILTEDNKKKEWFIGGVKI